MKKEGGMSSGRSEMYHTYLCIKFIYKNLLYI